MVELQELIKQYKLSKSGDKKATSYLLSNMGEGKLLKTDPSFEIMCIIQLAEQADENAYKTLYTLKEAEFAKVPLYIEPDYIKEEKKREEEAQILAEAKAWKEEMLSKKTAEEKARLEAEEKARQAELRRIEEEKEKEAKRLEKIETEEKEKILLEQKELELVGHLKATTTETLRKIVQDMVFIKGGNALLGNVNKDSNPPHMENVESFWIKKHSITKNEMETLLVDPSITTDNTSKFINRLSKLLDCPFDIPTSAQLEYAMRAKDSNFDPGNSPYRQIGDDRMIDYGTSTEMSKGSMVIVVKSLSEPIISLEEGISAKYFRIVCSDATFRGIKEKFGNEVENNGSREYLFVKED